MSDATERETSVTPPRAVQYLLPRPESFWRWSQDGKAIEWTDGRTIAFVGEVRAVLERLGPQGLPPFGAVVLLLAATRENWSAHAADDTADQVARGYEQIHTATAPASAGDLVVSVALPHRARQEIREVVDDLSAVAALPAELRQSMPARCALAEFVFARPALWSGADLAIGVLDVLTAGLDPVELQQTSPRDAHYAQLADELDALRSGLARVSAEPVSTFLKTGTDREVQPAPIPDLPPAAERVRALLRDLRGDDELAGLARLARDVMAALHVPRALASPEEIPVGGVSDIANRGPLDRLLVSELAHDDLTLAVRVALNEALYLRRESPARHPPLTRAVLIDSGIRTWGVPRLFATAVALALAATADAREPVPVARAHGDATEPVDLTSRAGVVAHLEALAPDPHPGRCLRRWLTDVTAGAEHDVETFIVTHVDALADPEFQIALRAAANGDHDCHVATVDGDGAFALWLISFAGRRRLCHAELSLEQVTAPPAPARPAPIPLRAQDADLPAIVNVQPFPLLLPAIVNPRHAVHSESHGLVGLTGDRRLMRWTGNVRGGEQLSAGVQGGRVFGVFMDETRGLAHVVTTIKRANTVIITTADLSNAGDCAQRKYRRNHPRQVFFHDGTIVLVYADELTCIDAVHGTEHGITLDRKTEWLNGRFFRGPQGVVAWTPHGFQPVTTHASVVPFDRPGDGPWLLYIDGDVGPADGQRVSPNKPFGGSVRYLAASPSGETIVIGATDSVTGGRGLFLLDLRPDALYWAKLPSPGLDDRVYERLVGDPIDWSTRASMNLRVRFDAVADDGEGSLLLASSRRGSIRIGLGDTGALRLKPGPRVNTYPRSAPFAQAQPPDGARFTMRIATWPDGSRAFLDGRGMLHLISADRTLPELTLTLTEPAMAGWTSDGDTFGWAYFLRDRPTADGRRAMDVLRAFTRRLR